MLLTEPTIGHSVNVATGNMQFDAIDFSVTGKLSLTWHRLFSNLSKDDLSPLGYGWHSPFFSKLSWNEEEQSYLFHAPNDSLVEFSAKDKQENNKIINYSAFSELIITNNHFIVNQWDIDTQNTIYYWFKKEDNGSISPLEKISNVSQQSIQLTYDSAQRLTHICQAQEKRTFQLHYNQNNLIHQIDLVTAENTHKTQIYYEYDDKKRLIKEINAVGGNRIYQYNKFNAITAITYKNGSTYDFIYNDDEQCIYAGTQQNFGSKQFQYFPIAGKSEQTNSKGDKVWYSFNTSGQILEEIDATGAVTKTELDQYDRVLAKTDANNNTTRYHYDQYGNRDQIIDALGNSTKFTYNQYHQVLTVIDAKNNQWSRTYNQNQQISSFTNPLNETYQFNYDRFNNLVEIINPAGVKLKQQFNAQGILQSTTDWLGNVSCYKFDELGNLIQFTDPLGFKTNYTYTATNLVSEISHPDKTNETFLYDSAGNVLVYNDRNNENTEYRYGLCNRLLEKIDAIGRQISFGWSTELEQLEELTNAKGEVYSFKYDAVGRITQEIGFDGRTLQYAYDAVGNRISTTNGLGEQINYTYDPLNQLIKQELPNGEYSHFEFDQLGYLTKAGNSTTNLAFLRDPLGRILSEQQNGHQIERTYNHTGDLLNLTLDKELSIAYQFDQNGLLSQAQLNQHDPIQIKRDARGSETSRTLGGNGLQLNQSFDVIGRIIEQSVSNDKQTSNFPANNIHRQYHYQNALLTGIQDDVRGKVEYHYDPVERLTKALRDKGASEYFQYDDNDNITQAKDDTETSEREYDSGDHLIKKDQYEYHYDQQGRLIQKTLITDKETQRWHYEWDALDQLIKFTNPEGQSWHYEYDPFGRRTCKIAPDGSKHQFIWDEDIVLQEQHDNQQVINWLFDPHSFMPLCKEEQGEAYSIISDHLGTPQEMLDQYGRLVWQAKYKAWGEIVEQQYNKIDCPIRFQGQWEDQESGLYYNRFRYYDTSTEKFISNDPIGLLGGTNLSSFAINPIGFIDPFGLCDIGEGKPGKPIVIKHPSKKAARRAAQRDSGMGKHGGREILPDKPSRPGSKAPQGDPGVRTETRSTDTGKVVHHDPYGHKDGNIPPHYGVDSPSGTIHHTYPTTHDPQNNR